MGTPLCACVCAQGGVNLCAGHSLFCSLPPSTPPLLCSVLWGLSPKNHTSQDPLLLAPGYVQPIRVMGGDQRVAGGRNRGISPLSLCSGNTSWVAASLGLHVALAASPLKGSAPAVTQPLGSGDPLLGPGPPPALVHPATADSGHLLNPDQAFALSPPLSLFPSMEFQWL